MGPKKWEANRRKKKWHLKKNDWDQNNGKQTTPSEKLASYNNGLGPKHGKQKNHKRNWHLKKRMGAKKWEAKNSKLKIGIGKKPSSKRGRRTFGTNHPRRTQNVAGTSWDERPLMERQRMAGARREGSTYDGK